MSANELLRDLEKMWQELPTDPFTGDIPEDFDGHDPGITPLTMPDIFSPWREKSITELITLRLGTHQGGLDLVIDPVGEQRTTVYLTSYGRCITPNRYNYLLRWLQSLAEPPEATPAQDAEAGASEVYRSRSLDLLDSRFSDDELRDLYFCLHIDYSNLPGEAKRAKARELILYCERHERMPELIKTVVERRPDITWPGVTS